MDFGIPESVQAARGCNPDIALAVFHKAADEIVRKAVAAREPVHLVLLQTKQSLARGADPDVAVTVADHGPAHER